MPFDAQLAQVMSKAGCIGINFGVDHSVPGLLHNLGRNHLPDDLMKTAHACKSAGVTVMFDMLLGGPGETKDSIRKTVGGVNEGLQQTVNCLRMQEVYSYACDGTAS